MTLDLTPLALSRLITFASPSLPIGAFAYSEALEAAVDAGAVHDAASAEDWVVGRLSTSVARTELPLLLRLHDAWAVNDLAAVRSWSELGVAMRDTAELRAADRQLGTAMARLLATLGVEGAEPLRAAAWTGYATTFALAAVRAGVPRRAAAVAFATAWADAQASAAVRLVPLGQSDGQRILLAAATGLEDWLLVAEGVADDDVGASAPGVALLSARHETQYARLFRS